MSASALGHCLMRSSTMPRPKNTGQWRSSMLRDPLDRGVVGRHGVGIAFLAAQQVGQGQRGVDAVGLLGDQRRAACCTACVEALLLGVERGRAQPRLPVERRGRRRPCRRRPAPWPDCPTARRGRRSSARRSRDRASGRRRTARRSARGRRAGCAGRRSGRCRCRTGSRKCPRRATAAWASARWRADQPVHHHGVAVLLAEGLQQRARIVGLAEPAQAVGRRDRRRAGRGSSSMARRYLASAAALSPAISSICASITRTGASARSPCRASAWQARARAATKSFCAGLQPGQHEVAQRTELVLARRCGRAAARRRGSRPS